MPNIFCKSEKPMLLEEVSLLTKHINRDDYQQIVNFNQKKKNLTEIFNCCDSLLDERNLDNDIQNTETLVQSLSENGSTLSVLLPSKVSIGRCLSIVEFNLYGFLCKLCNKYEDLYRFKKDLLIKWEKVLFMLLIEEVYQNIIDNHETQESIKKTAAENLIKFWEERDSTQNISFAVNIFDLWKSRRTIVPVFGTMLGTYELMNLSSLLSIRWHDFLAVHSRNREMLHSLEEFIFGLTFNQIKKIRNYMSEKKILTIDDEDIQIILEPENHVLLALDEDPRQMYSFYRGRTERANHRKATGEPGPKKTIEELFMIYLLSEQLEKEKQNVYFADYSYF